MRRHRPTPRSAPQPFSGRNPPPPAQGTGQLPPLARVSNQPGFAKDQKTGAILNISQSDAAAWKARAEVLKAQKSEMDRVKADIKELKERLDALEKKHDEV